MNDWPIPIRREYQRRKRVLLAGIIAFVVAMAIAQQWHSLVGALIGVTGPIFLLAATTWFTLFIVSVPRRIEAHIEAEQKRAQRAAEQRKRAEEQQAAARIAREAAVQAKIRDFHSILSDPVGTRRKYETVYGEFWATRGVDGSLRLWWPPFGRLIEHAKSIVTGKARWIADDVEGWFVYRGQEARVLTELARL